MSETERKLSVSRVCVDSKTLLAYIIYDGDLSIPVTHDTALQDDDGGKYVFGKDAHIRLIERKNEELRKEIEHLKATQHCPAPFHVGGDCWCDSSQGGPVCNCEMRNVREVNGRYIHFKDVGPIKGDGS